MKWLVLIVSLFFSTNAYAGVCISFACVKAEAKGLPEIAEAMKQWSYMLPQLNQDFHAGVKDDLLLMDHIAENAILRLDRMAQDNINLSGEEARSIISFAVSEINKAGSFALHNYQKALFETECSAENIIETVAGRFRIWPFSTSTVKGRDFSGKKLKIKFDKESKYGKKEARYKLYTAILASGMDTTSIEKLEETALNRQTIAYELHCLSRATHGVERMNDSHHFSNLQIARRDYQAIRTIRRQRM